MKTILLVVASVTLALAASAQSTNDWLTLDAAGGASISGNYAVNFTLGQPDVGATNSSSSANYRIITGFWAAENLGPQTATPTLHIVQISPAQVRIWWASAGSAGFLLQSSPNLNPPIVWSPVLNPVNDNGVERSVLEPVNGAPRFYRLRRN